MPKKMQKPENESKPRIMVQVRSSFSKKRDHTCPANIGVRAFQSGHGGCQLLWGFRILFELNIQSPDLNNYKLKSDHLAHPTEIHIYHFYIVEIL